MVLNPRLGELVTLDMSFHKQLTDWVPEVGRSEHFTDARFKPECEFLERLKHDYGYVSDKDLETRTDDPKYAYYFWKRDNGEVTDGPIKVRKYPGDCFKTDNVTVMDQLQDGDIQYIGHFKGGVHAYDSKADKSWVVFHPDDMYSWPTKLVKYGDLLVIGTRGEGLAVIDVAKNRMKRIPLEPPNDEIREIRIEGNQIVVNDDTTVALPVFGSAH